MVGVGVRVWLDDVRTAPPGWLRAFAPEEVIALLRSGRVTELSLDHDLGLEPGRTGFAVLVWLEREVKAGRWTGPLPDVSVHSGNPARRRMLRLLGTIHRLHPAAALRISEHQYGRAPERPEEPFVMPTTVEEVEKLSWGQLLYLAGENAEALGIKARALLRCRRRHPPPSLRRSRWGLVSGVVSRGCGRGTSL